MAIYLALLKHGYSNFQLEILEYCKKSELIKREQYYLDLLQPEYNILKIADSRLGSKHSVETKKKMSGSRLGEGNTFFGKFHSNETKAKLREAQKDNSQTLEVLDLSKNETTSYASIREAARAISCAPSAIHYSLKKSGAKAYKGRFKFFKGGPG